VKLGSSCRSEIHNPKQRKKLVMSQEIKPVVVGTEVKPVDLGNGMSAKLGVWTTKRGNMTCGFFLRTKKGSNSFSDLWLNEKQSRVVFKAFPEFYPVMEKMLVRAKQIHSVGCEIKNVNPRNQDGTNALRGNTTYKLWVNMITKDGWRPVVNQISKVETKPVVETKPEPVVETKPELIVPDNPFDALDGFNS